MANLKRFPTRTGCIFVDMDRRVEFLYVGDYGQENNIKAEFLGLNKEINGVPHHDVDLGYKLVVTISTQKGCPMHCAFCDCPKVKFGGNVSREELAYQVETAIRESGATYTRRFNLHLARMGEPSFNAKNVLNFLQFDLRSLVNGLINADTIHPVFTTMMPKALGKEKLQSILLDFCDLKNYGYRGEAGLQLKYSTCSGDDDHQNASFKLFTFKLPINVTYKLYIPHSEVAFAPYAGVYFRAGLTGKQSLNSNKTDLYDHQLANTTGAEWERCQLGWQAGLRIWVQRFYVGFQYGKDFPDENKLPQICQSSVTFGVTF